MSQVYIVMAYIVMALMSQVSLEKDVSGLYSYGPYSYGLMSQVSLEKDVEHLVDKLALSPKGGKVPV